MLESRDIQMGHAWSLRALSCEVQQLNSSKQVVNKGLSVRVTEALVRRLLARDSKPKKKAGTEDKDVQRLEMDLSDRLGAKVRVDHTRKGSGNLVISYNSLDELEGILKHIK